MKTSVLDFIVMAGLDPAIHADPQETFLTQWRGRRHVDTRVKPAHDEAGDHGMIGEVR